MKLTAELIGDMAIKDLSPKDANSSGRIIKNMRICGSGLYEYHVSEAPYMGLTIPSAYHGDTFKVYRSPEVLKENKDLYARVPIITGHHVRVNTSNAKQLAVGMVGDTVETEVGDDGELYLYTTGTIITGDGIEAYEKYGELSVGYDPVVEWEPGNYKGREYQAVLRGFNEINHLLICKEARGGHQCMIMDSLDMAGSGASRVSDKSKNGGKEMGIFKKIFSKPAPNIQSMYGDAKVVSAVLQSIKAGADCKTQVELAKTLMGDKVDEKLKGFFEELSGDEVKEASPETLAKAVDVVDAYARECLGDEGKEEPEPKDKEPERKEEPKEPEEKKELGDSIDYEKLADMVAQRLKPQTGDEKKETDENPLEASRISALLSGDSKEEVAVSSDSIMKEIWG